MQVLPVLSCGPESNTAVAATASGIDAEARFRAQFSRALACMGLVDQAALQVRPGLEQARRLNHLSSLAVALSTISTTSWIIRDIPSLRAMSDALVALAGEQGFAFWLARGRCYAGWVAAQDGDAERGQTLLNEGLSGLRSAGVVLYGPHNHAMLADAYTAGGQIEAALGAVETGLSIMTQTGEAWPGAELYRRKAELLLANGGSGDGRRDPVAAAEALFRRAIALARSQGATLFELRAATSLARLWLNRDRQAEAHDLLAPVYARFTEGFDAPDLKQARDMLAVSAASGDRPAPPLAAPTLGRNEPETIRNGGAA